MDKKKLIAIVSIVIILLIGLFLIIFKEDEKPLVSDAVKFRNEYLSVGEDNVFVYRDIDEIINIMENGTGVVYLGFPECPWCKTYVKYLNEVAKEEGIEKIYYYNIYNDRKENTDKYQKIVSILEKYLQNDEEGKKRIYVPNVSFHVNGEVIGNDCETSLDTKGFDDPTLYWTEDEVKDLKQNLKTYMEKVYIALNSCTDCNK